MWSVSMDKKRRADRREVQEGVFEYIVEQVIKQEEEPSNLRQISERLRLKDGRVIQLSAVQRAISSLKDQNLIHLNESLSNKTGRKEKVYLPTFKGILRYLSKFIVVYPIDSKCHNIELFLRGTSEHKYELPGKPYYSKERMTKLKNDVEFMKLFEKWSQAYNDSRERLKNILERHSTCLDYIQKDERDNLTNSDLPEDVKQKILERDFGPISYPLFKHCDFLKMIEIDSSYDLYEKFINISRHMLEQSMQQTFEKLNPTLQLLPKEGYKVIGKGGRAITEEEEQAWRDSLKPSILKDEDAILAQFFFIEYVKYLNEHSRITVEYLKKHLDWQSRVGIANKELYNYTKRLLDWEESEYTRKRKTFEEALSVFKP